MNQKITGILGYGGYIGRYATEKLLNSGFTVIGGQRKKSDLFDKYENFSYEYVDVKNSDILKTFIEKCDIVVNCVSPSHIFGKLVKDAVCSAGKIYIDPSDASFETDRDNTKGICIASAGYIPGLSEFLPCVVAKQEFDEIDRVVIYQGGFDGCSPGSFVDMIIGTGNSRFYGDSFIKDGMITPLGSNIRKTHSTPFSDKKVIFKPLINSDNIRLQQRLNANELYFFCTYDDMATLSFFMKLLVDVTKYDKETAAKNIENKLNERIKTNEAFGNQIPSAFLYIELSGKKNGTDKAVSYKIYLTNVNKVCGYFLGETVKTVLKFPDKVHEGFNYGFELVDDNYAERVLSEIGDDEYIKFEIISEDEKVSVDKLTN